MKSVYILGAGGIGSLVASQLVNKFNVNFILRSAYKIDKFRNDLNYNVTLVERFNQNKEINFKVHECLKVTDLKEDKKLDYLIVSVKTFDTLESLKSVLPFIDYKYTRIILIQNGMGVMEELYQKLWPDINTRPRHIFQGVISHGIFQDDKVNPFKFVHAGNGDFKIAKLPFLLPEEEVDVKMSEETTSGNDSNIDDIIESLCDPKSTFNGKHFKYSDLLIYQIEKLMVNLCINPVTSILNCINGELNPIKPTLELFKNIINEALSILDLKFVKYFNQSPDLYDKILKDRTKVLNYVVDCGTVINKQNSSSMRQDVLNLRPIEIEYINGYIVKLAESLELKAQFNETIVLLAKSRLQLELNRKESAK